MNVVMLTNTYVPHVGGVARSVDTFARALRDLGHRVCVVAPMFAGAEEDEPGVLRVPALVRFNGSDFSVRVPVPGLLSEALDRFDPDVVHSHHPFLLGDAALRIATTRNLPLVFTHHTLYEQYTHYVPGDSPALKRFVVQLASEYANLCDHVVAPSASIGELLRGRGVSTPQSVIPTGIDLELFAAGDGPAARHRCGIPPDALLVGTVGRLAPEKNLAFLTRAVTRFLAARAEAHFLLVGTGPLQAEVEAGFAACGLGARLHPTGVLTGSALADAYAALDVFAFASLTETQGLVLAEALAAGAPVVALDAPGARDVVRDGANGRLLPATADEEAFAAALGELAAAAPARRQALRGEARRTAAEVSRPRCAQRLAELYRQLVEHQRRQRDDTLWAQTLRMVETEWNLWATRAAAALRSFGPDSPN